jgi:putative DNA methylase
VLQYTSEPCEALFGKDPKNPQTDTRALLDRLFRIATDKGWAQEALVYNQLAEEWPHLLERARAPELRRAKQATADLFA